MKPSKHYILFLLILFITQFVFSQQKKDKIVFQSAPIISLLNGVMNDNFPIGKIKAYGNFGLGTFNGVDGEMIVLDGKVYQVKNNGKVNIPPNAAETPFATVTFFNSDKTIILNDTLSFKKLGEFLDKNLPSTNLIYAVKITGVFKSLETRSEPKQTKTYSNLSEVLKNQSVFRFKNIKGTMVGFRFPAYMQGINAPGYHFHFLSSDKKAGGHALSFVTGKIKIEIDFIKNVRMKLPGSEEFYKSDLTQN